MKLIGSLTSPYVRKARIVAAEKRVEYAWEPHNVWAPENPVPDYNPLGKVPVLVLDDGTALYDSRVICEFLDSVSPIGKLIPADNRERIEVRRWEALADGALDAGVLARLEGQRPAAERSASWIDRQMGKVARSLDAMDIQIGTRPWCHGAAFTLADVAVGACVGWFDFRFPQLEWRKDRPNLARLAVKLAERPSFAETAPRE
ncbi:MAG: glutathione S-transferase N-terminal domain-containing protein [Burkholderiales bacterium]